MKHILFLLSSTWLFTGCSDDFFSQTVTIDPPPYEKHLSFHLLTTDQDSTVQFFMTRNYGILEDVKNYDDWFVKGASAELYENGQKWLTLSPVDPGNSSELTGLLPHPFQAGSTYEIRASHPDFKSVSAVQVAPGDLNIDSVRIRYDAVTGEFGDRLNLLEVFLNDQPGVKNYYEVTLSGVSYQIIYGGGGNMDTLGVQEYPLYVDGYSDPNVVEGFKAGGLISDQFFDGKSYKFQARFYANENSTVDSTITVRVRNVTEDYFKWSRSYLQHYDSDENPLVEPISVFNNLENGLGIFTIAREKRYQLKR
jgi:hypothetical protein